ncbi:polyamine deacetylase HDAC10 isoform X2 [Syngnathus scovelli]|uniref:polyamine deacetylase HDAC10 isoform X2 n=1 Tax=Syngnathus scovelli TaxID=161590 RepID=UPI0021105C93|nr:polyamine deacetylase HDAC10 isoform X2 [Syngnathus scovelli]
MGTALIYDEEMTRYKLLWLDPDCELERPERLTASYEALVQSGLAARCISVPVRKATDDDILLIHSEEYLEAVKKTPYMTLEDLREFTLKYGYVYFHPNSYHCALLAAGAALQLVDAVMSGRVRNGMALVRPPGHHSMRSAANGFCVFNNVAIAAKYAQGKYGAQRVLIVDWDIHHGQGVQYAFEDDPSVLYFSWHRYEHQKFWPELRESDYDSVGEGKGAGFNINVPWNKVGMRNGDYLAVFCHVLLPVAYQFCPDLVLVCAGFDSAIGDPEGEMCATPDVFAHLTHLLMNLAEGKLCMVLEVGYILYIFKKHLNLLIASRKRLAGWIQLDFSRPVRVCHGSKSTGRSGAPANQPSRTLSEHAGVGSVCARSSSQVLVVSEACRYWTDEGNLEGKYQLLVHLFHKHIKYIEPLSEIVLYLTPAEAPPSDVSTKRIKLEEKRQSGETAEGKDNISWPEPEKCVAPPVRTAVVIPEDVDCPDGCERFHLPQNACSRSTKENFESDAVTKLSSLTALVGEMEKNEIRNGLALVSDVSMALETVIKHATALKQRVLVVCVGGNGVLSHLPEDGTTLTVDIHKGALEMPRCKHYIPVSLKNGCGETSGLVQATFGLLLPLAYEYDPALVLLARFHGTDGPSEGAWQQLVGLLGGLARGHMLVLVQVRRRGSSRWIRRIFFLPGFHFRRMKRLSGSPAPSLGQLLAPLAEDLEALERLRLHLQADWTLLRTSVQESGSEDN